MATHVEIGNKKSRTSKLLWRMYHKLGGWKCWS